MHMNTNSVVKFKSKIKAQMKLKESISTKCLSTLWDHPWAYHLVGPRRKWKRSLPSWLDVCRHPSDTNQPEHLDNIRSWNIGSINIGTWSRLELELKGSNVALALLSTIPILYTLFLFIFTDLEIRNDSSERTQKTGWIHEVVFFLQEWNLTCGSYHSQKAGWSDNGQEQGRLTY